LPAAVVEADTHCAGFHVVRATSYRQIRHIHVTKPTCLTARSIWSRRDCSEPV
jgi:hypothetical protein